MRLFITGGSGFVGGAVIRSLVDRHRILAMARSDRAAETVSRLGADPVRCSLDDLTPDHLVGIEAVVHCAAYVASWGRPDDYWRANVEGTARVVDAARKAGVRRLVHISTESVLFTGDHLRAMDESWPYPDKTSFPYSASKGAAERLVREAAEQMETIVLRPILIWGPGDRTVLPELEEMAEAGRYVWVDGGRHRVSTTHVDNVAHAVGLALEYGHSGAVYFITDGETTTYREFLTRYAATAGVELGDRSVPGWLARWAGSLVEGAWKVVRPGREPPLNRFAVALLSHEITVDSDKARRELGYQPKLTIESGLAALEQGSVPASRSEDR
ncbi:MAG TPA: NAD-dependent epimerase/dehydratase family protein [Acidimicrobiia bacterium]|nr:NAD-dependent epimerase/dehydratase family protein [Acidimicrobiia bacterium]